MRRSQATAQQPPASRTSSKRGMGARDADAAAAHGHAHASCASACACTPEHATLRYLTASTPRRAVRVIARLVRARLLFGGLARLVHLRARRCGGASGVARPRFTLPERLPHDNSSRWPESPARQWAAVGRVRTTVGRRVVSGGGGGDRGRVGGGMGHLGGISAAFGGISAASRRHLGRLSADSWPRLVNQPDVDRLHVVLELLCLRRGARVVRSGGRGCRPRDLVAISARS